MKTDRHQVKAGILLLMAADEMMCPSGAFSWRMEPMALLSSSNFCLSVCFVAALFWFWVPATCNMNFRNGFALAISLPF